MSLAVKKSFVIILIIVSIRLSAEELKKNEKYFSPDGVSYFYYTEDGKTTTGYIWNNIGKKEIKLFSFELRYKLNEENIFWYGRSFEIKIHTGSPGVFSIFYIFEKQSVISSIWFVVAVDKTGRFALLAQETIFIFDLLENKSVLNIELQTEKSAILYLLIDLKSTYFDENGDLYIMYLNKKKIWEKILITKKKYYRLTE